MSGEAAIDATGLYREIFLSAPENILLLDRERIIQANTTAGEFFGVSPDQLVGRTPAELSPEYQPDGIRTEEKMYHLLEEAGRGPMKVFWVHRAAGGIERETSVTLTPIRVDGISLVVATVRDVTPLLDAGRRIESQNRLLRTTNTVISAIHRVENIEDALKIIADELGSIFGNSIIAIYLTDHDAGDAVLMAIRAPESCLDGLSGYHLIPLDKDPYAAVYQRGESIFCDILDLHCPGVTGFAEYGMRIAPTGICIIPLIADKTVYGSINIYKIGEESIDPDEQSHLISIGREIGGAIRTQKIKEEVKDAHDMANLFLDILIHDVNNAHMAIGAGLDLMMDAEGEERKQHAGIIRSALKSAAEIHQNVMMIRRIRESGEQSLRPVALDPIIKGAVPPRTNFRLKDSGVSVIADHLISGIFTNLFSNAKKHGGPDVTIEIRTEVKGDRVIITVADDGPGIPDQDKERLFERYTRLSSRSRGLGIGLFLCRTLASRYGGSIRVDDRVPGHPEKGSAFILTLRSAEMRDQP